MNDIEYNPRIERWIAVFRTICAFLLGLIIGGLAIGWRVRGHAGAPAFDTPFQAVLLDNGQVYYGKVEGLGTDFPKVNDVYYIQQTQNPATKEVSNVLIRRG